LVGHAATPLVDLGAGTNTRRRVADVPDVAEPPAQSDLMGYDCAAASPYYRGVVGQPVHPTTMNGAVPFAPPDPRGYRNVVYARAALQLPLDLNGDGTDDIENGARFRFIFRHPGQPVPTDQADAEDPAKGYITPDTPASGGIINGTDPGFYYQIPPDASGIGRIYLEWQNPGPPPRPWYFNTTPDGQTVSPLVGAYVCSRLQVPPTGDQWRNGGGLGVPGPVERPGSFLARVLVGPLVGGLRDDLYMPGALTVRRPFTLINRGTTPVETVEAVMLQGLVPPPGVRAAGRPTVRPRLPDSAVTIGPAGSGVAGGAVGTGRWAQVSIPRYQPASEPGDTLPRNAANNWGYRGLTVLFGDANANGTWNLNLSANLDQNSDSVEEYTLFDVQVSVDKDLRLLAATATAEPGRVCPGVPASAPDTTVGAPPPGRFPFGSNVALTDRFVISNEGNVVAPPVLLTPNQSIAEPVSVAGKFRSLGRLLAANPVWLPPAAYTSLLAGSLAPGLSGEAGGWGTTGVAGAGTLANPIPLGQGQGQYSGQVVYFVDLNGNSQLDFIDGLTGQVLNTAVASFDARRDEPLEPVSAVSTSLRVAESRLPYNDYYAADTEPTLRFDYGPGGVTNLQVMWVSNRASVALGGGGVNAPAPAGTSPAAAAQPHFPGNIIFANATPVAVPGAPDYRPFAWAPEAANLTGTTAAANPGGVNASPETYNDLSGTHWALWHRSLRTGTGASSTLHYKTSGNTGWAGTENFIYATGLPKQGIRGFADPSGSGQWLFWTEGEQGRQTIHYRWNFTGTADNKEAPVPVTNAVSAEYRSDVLNDFASGAPMRKPSMSPFVYTKDPTAFLWVPPPGVSVGTQVNVIFSGYTARQQNEDLFWAAFDQAAMNDPAQNYGKLTFPRVVNNPVLPATGAGTRAGEQLVGDGLRQTFVSRHLDWLVSPTFENAPLAARDARDPRLYLGLVFSTAPATPALYAVDWGPGFYSRARGAYRVTPVFTPILGAPALPAAVQVPGRPGVLRNPLAGGNPVLMEIEPATGTVTLSAALFNVSNRSDQGAVFNRTVAGLGNLINVVMYADYTPFLFRLTTSDAADDSPNAFAEVDAADPNQLRLVFLWRRSYSQKDTPSFGRTDFMYKTWTLGVQVARPPMVGNVAVSAWNGTGWTALNPGQTQDYTVNADSGIISMVADGYRTGDTRGVFWLKSALDGARLRVRYNGGVLEEHRVIGWSQETSVPVDTVQNEGPLRAVPEIYTVSNGAGGGMSAVRYWLVWSSPRAVYDLRLPAANGSVLHQSSDIYLGTVVPQYGQALRDQEVEWQNVE